MSHTIRFYYDVVCPYAFLGAVQLEKKTDLVIEWVPVLLGGIYKAIEAPQFPSNMWSRPKQLWNQEDLLRQVQRQAIEGFVFNPNHPQRTVECQRFLSVVPPERRPEITMRMYKAYWQEQMKFPCTALLNELATELGMEANCFSAEKAKEQLSKNTAQAIAEGCFGVPSFRFREQLWWGQDRLEQIFAQASTQSTLEKARQEWSANKDNRGKELTVFHDFASPFSYLAMTQVNAFATAHQCRLNIKPILLGALFKKIGTPIVPIFEMSTSKQAYLWKEMQLWSRWWRVDFNFPSRFPLRSILPLRASIVEPKIINAVYNAYWVDGKDISDTSVFKSLLDDEGFNGDDIIAKSSSQAIKDQLRENTELAEKLNVCGVPTFMVDDKKWWGQDRLSHLSEYLCRR